MAVVPAVVRKRRVKGTLNVRQFRVLILPLPTRSLSSLKPYRTRTMSTEDYDEFGNYIGGDLDSDDESDIDIPTQAQTQPVPSSSTAPGASAQASGSYAPLEGFDEEDEDEPMDEDAGMQMTLHGVDGTAGNQVVLHEDKTYYATAAETYGEDVEAMVQEEDQQLLSEPIVAPVKVRAFTVQEKGLPTTRFDRK